MAQFQQSSSTPATLVTGGSGFIGRSFVKKLSESGQTIISMYHHRLPEPMANVYPVCSDMGSPELLAAPLRGVQSVVHLAWEGSLVGPQEAVTWNIESSKVPRNILNLRNLIKAMEKVGTRRIIFVSAIGASRKASTPFLQEKYLGEFTVLNSKIPEKIILRSSVVCGGGASADRFLNSIVNLMKMPGFYPVPDAQDRIAPVHIDDLTETLYNLLEKKLTHESALLEVNGQESYRVEEIFKMVSDRYAKGSRLALRGFIGDSLLPFFERESRKNPVSPRLKHFLALGQDLDSAIQTGNPLVDALPKKPHSFKEMLSMSQAAS